QDPAVGTPAGHEIAIGADGDSGGEHGVLAQPGEGAARPQPYITRVRGHQGAGGTVRGEELPLPAVGEGSGEPMGGEVPEPYAIVVGGGQRLPIRAEGQGGDAAPERVDRRGSPVRARGPDDHLPPVVGARQGPVLAERDREDRRGVAGQRGEQPVIGGVPQAYERV